MPNAPDSRREELSDLVDRLLVRDPDEHAAAIDELAAVGDERVVPHLLELMVIDSIAGDWGRFGFPEVLREHSPPRYLELPEARWPGVGDALRALAEPNFDSGHAWVEWESWYSQQEIEPLEGFDEWKLQLYRSYLPPVGSLLEATPRAFDLRDVRWGNCDRSFLAALNGPDFVPGEAVDAGDGADRVDGENGAEEPRRYLRDDDHVFGFVLDGVPYCVPRKVLFPHELANATIAGRPVSLTYCTLCNAPILYDRRVDGEVLTFGSSGMLLAGNKVMFDEETESLWSQHRGEPIAGEFLEREVTLDVLPVTQATWAEWKRAEPDTLALDLDTGYDFDYAFYDDEIGIFRHYWENEDVVQPGVRRDREVLPEKEEVYGIAPDGAGGARIYPVETVLEGGPIVDEFDGRRVVALADPAGDVAVYAAPPSPIERDGDRLVAGDGTTWRIARDALVADGERLERLAGRHGLWFAFRIQYPDATVVTESADRSP